MTRLKPIMLAGTGSDVGKSVLAAGLCRIFRQEGYNPAPFKAQNMALNSGATPDGLEIGRAQVAQAEAAGIPPSVLMNPLLLKPQSDHTSQVVLLGKPIGNRDAYSYFRTEGREELRAAVTDAFRKLEAEFNPIVMEGAGSISELNLKDTDLVNMPMAREAGADVILVADIDRGGVFASAYGSVMLQDEADRKRIKGIIINKFRGDIRLFEEGRRIMERICGVPVLGIVPYFTDIHIEEEDSVSLAKKASEPIPGMVNIAVVRLPHISNFTDFNALERINGVNIFFSSDATAIRQSDAIILPGTKSTLADLAWLREKQIDTAILSARDEAKTIFGICGGYQMMGREISDPDGIEGDIKMLPGLGLLPASTTIGRSKVTRTTPFRFLDSGCTCEGYEIHMGDTVMLPGARPLNTMADGSPDGCIADSRCAGSYIHGILDNKAPLEWLLAPFADRLGAAPIVDYRAFKEQQYDLLASRLRECIDIERIIKILSTDD